MYKSLIQIPLEPARFKFSHNVEKHIENALKECKEFHPNNDESETYLVGQQCLLEQLYTFGLGLLVKNKGDEIYAEMETRQFVVLEALETNKGYLENVA